MSAGSLLRLAMGQMLVEGARPTENLRRAVTMIEQAAREGCRAIVLPECLDVGWTHPAAEQLAAEVPGPTSDVLCQAALRAGIYVAAGLTERAGGRRYNAAVLIDPQGRILLKHRKINLLDIEQPFYATGDRLQVVETDFGVVGVNICADNFPDSLALGHSLARMGAQILLSPSAWAVPADHDHAVTPYGDLWTRAYGGLARLYDLPIVGTSNVGWIAAGPWSGRKCIGCSLAMAGDGRVTRMGSYGVDAAELILIEMKLRPCGPTGTELAPLLRARGYTGP